MTSEISISSNDSSVPGIGGHPTHGNSESSVLPITGHKRNGLNYLQWSQSVFMFLSGKGKQDYLTRTIETPSKDDPNYKTWNSENHMLDMFENITWDCQLDKKKYGKIVEKESIFKLLLGLNKDLDEVRGRILGTKPLPSLREAFSEVSREESKKKIMMGRPGILISGGSFALVAYGTNKGSDNQPHKGIPWCDHCRRPGHIKIKCWKIHGKPADWKPRKPQSENRGYVAITEEKPISEDVVFSKEQLELLQNMFNQAQINPPVIGVRNYSPKRWFITFVDDHTRGEKSPPNFHVQNTGKWKNLAYSRKPRDNVVEHPTLLENYQNPNPSIVPTKAGDDYEEMNRLKTILAKELEIKDLGNVVSQFMNNPTEEHLDAVYRIMRYLKMTPGKGLYFKKGYRKNIDIYCDADWAGFITDRRSTSGYCTYVWGNLVTWRSKKLSEVSKSSAEAEFRAIALSFCEGMWLKRLLEELKIT
ncbi:hypothetical protein RJ639_016327 [Escallonia herrerae]|uniref:Retrotransposon Copia-like N-terminal domain-containing protein n=1 Tax=Escallonia herrerae TaxID=1293975 RepID=A0AA88VGW9_9ASTE|nr:hypothetical protein RJ639_016327 [Escallonia herrerae]